MSRFRYAVTGIENTATLKRELKDEGVVEADSLIDVLLVLIQRPEFLDALDYDGSASIEVKPI